MGVQLEALPEGVRTARASPARLRSVSVALSASLLTIALGWGGLVFLIPQPVGTAILGATWGPAHAVVIPLSLVMAGSGIIAGASVGLRALAAAGRSLRARILHSSLDLVGAVVGSALDGAPSAAWGLAAAVWCGAGTWWWHFHRALAEENSKHVIPRAEVSDSAERSPPPARVRLANDTQPPLGGLDDVS
jgi:hypothetical protein